MVHSSNIREKKPVISFDPTKEKMRAWQDDFDNKP